MWWCSTNIIKCGSVMAGVPSQFIRCFQAEFRGRSMKTTYFDDLDVDTAGYLDRLVLWPVLWVLTVHSDTWWQVRGD
jgi:hypothetical protein